MSALNDADRDLLRKIRDAKCDPGCPCDGWAQALADHLRRELPDVGDITLGRITLIASQHGHSWTRHHNADGLQVAVVLCAAAAELASLHLD